MTISIPAVRKLFPATRRMNYLFNGGLSLVSTPVKEAMRKTISEFENGIGIDNWQKWMRNISEAYELFANLIGAKAEETVAIQNTTIGMAMIARMIDSKPGTNIVLDDLEYPTIYPFTTSRKSGVEMRITRNKEGYIDVKELESLTDDRTSAIVVSSVSCWNGYRYDIKELSEIAHKHGAYLVLDAAQQVGAVRLDVKRECVDFLATCGHKWLLGPVGTGFLYVRRELIERLDPPMPGWMSLPEPEGVQNENWQPEFPKTAQRFETGMPNLVPLAGIRASLELIHKLGLENIEKDILKRTGYIVEKLRDMGVRIFTPIEMEHRAGLVTFLLKKYETLYRELLKHSIVTFQHPENVAKIYHWPNGGLRVDPTFFNTMDELDEFLKYVKKHL